jgi:fructose-specific component phosphotransferase system IIB-like protein
MSNDLIEHPQFDFTRYQPGDTFVISAYQIASMGQAKAIMLTAAIANAASRAGLEWRTYRRPLDDAFCVDFSEGLPTEARDEGRR